MLRITSALIAVAALCMCTSLLVSAVETRENVCLNLIETHCDGDANPAVMTTCIEKGLLTCGALPNHCQLASETGMCRAAFPRFYFNVATGSCEQFIYGGCGGNANNFESQDECQDSCSGVRYCGGNTGATCPKNYQCSVDQQQTTGGDVGMCVLVPAEKRANGGHNKKKKPHSSGPPRPGTHSASDKPHKTPRAQTP